MSAFLDHFQLAGLAFFLLALVERTLYLRLRKRINPIRLRVANSDIRHFIEVSLVIAVTVWAIEVVFYAIHARVRIFPAPLHIRLVNALPAQFLGVALIILGFTLFTLALIHLGTSWRMGLDETTPGELVTNGVYALSRNPIYIFFDLYFIGTFLINGTLIFLIFAAFVTVNLHYQILEEEKFLLKLYGPAYQAYCARTGRYITLRRSAQGCAQEG